MRNWRILQGFKITTCPKLLFALLALFTLFGSAKIASSQQRNYPGPAAREGNRAMDDYDRAINRMKNDAKAVNERRRNLFPQINEDFQRIQIIHNEIVRMLKTDKSLNYDRLADLSDDMKKRTARLRTNLALPEPEKTEEAQRSHAETVDESHVKEDIADLHDLIVSFVANPIFKNLGVVDSTVIDSASKNLDDIILASDEIKREARILGKSKK
jgi:hypothetical protein